MRLVSSAVLRLVRVSRSEGARGDVGQEGPLGGEVGEAVVGGPSRWPG